MDINTIAAYLTSGVGHLVAAGLLWAVVAAFKQWPWLVEKIPLKTPWQKRAVAAVLASLPAIALAAGSAAPLKDILSTAITAFLGAIGIHHMIDTKKDPDAESTPVFSDKPLH